MHVTVASITLERRGNADLMLRSMESLAGQGMQACVGDGGSSPEFITRLRAMGHTVMQTGNGLRGQMEVAFRTAAQRGTHVLYFESDKSEFAQNRIGATIRQYRSRGLEYAVAGRTRELWDTFPLPQREIERAQCSLMGDVLGTHGDWIGGPALLPSSHVGALAESRFDGTDQHGWGVPWFLLGRAWATGLNVGIVKTATGVHPNARDEFNPGYRLYQADAILGSFYEGAGIEYDWRNPNGERVNSVSARIV